MQLREFRMDDYQQVIAVWQATGLRVGRTETQEGIRKKLERDSDLFLVAQDGDRIVGVVLGSYDGRRGWINRLAVAPDHQGAGIGLRLVAEVEARLKARGCRKVNLLIVPSNAKVQGFYARLGYGVDELIFMEKWLG